MINVFKELLFFNLIPLIIGFFLVSDFSIKKSIALGWSIVFLNIVIGLIAFNLSKNEENKRFLKIYFGGMIFRLILLLSIIFIILKFIGINPISFLFSLFIFYIINQIIELRYIIKSLSKK